jgi:biopolymer transport protein ExbB/biopolymer transport protein TolQ
MSLILIIESIAQAEEASGFTLSEIWAHSGLIARGTILLLVSMMLGTLAVGIDRLLAFNKARQQSISLAAEIVAPLQKNDIVGALKIVNKEDYKESYLGALLRAGLRELDARNDRHGVDNARRSVEKAHGEEIAKMRRGMTILATTGSTAPFVGLFGTTFGVINAFQGMATAGSGLASISAGISEALITTGVGIGVAVLGVWAFNYFNLRTEKVMEELESSEADFLGWTEKLLQLDSQAAK